MLGVKLDNSINNNTNRLTPVCQAHGCTTRHTDLLYLDKLTGSVALFFVTIHVDSGISHKYIKVELYNDMVTKKEEHSLLTRQAILRGKSFPFSEKYAGLDFTDYLTSAYFGVNRDISKILK